MDVPPLLMSKDQLLHYLCYRHHHTLRLGGQGGCMCKYVGVWMYECVDVGVVFNILIYLLTNCKMKDDSPKL